MSYTGRLSVSLLRSSTNELALGETSCYAIHMTFSITPQKAVATYRTVGEEVFGIMIIDCDDWDRMLGVKSGPCSKCLIRVYLSR